jgi:hypothetical protein
MRVKVVDLSFNINYKNLDGINSDWLIIKFGLDMKLRRELIFYFNNSLKYY